MPHAFQEITKKAATRGVKLNARWDKFKQQDEEPEVSAPIVYADELPTDAVAHDFIQRER